MADRREESPGCFPPIAAAGIIGGVAFLAFLFMSLLSNNAPFTHREDISALQTQVAQLEAK